jgi:hypothetical protein
MGALGRCRSTIQSAFIKPLWDEDTSCSVSFRGAGNTATLVHHPDPLSGTGPLMGLGWLKFRFPAGPRATWRRFSSWQGEIPLIFSFLEGENGNHHGDAVCRAPRAAG